MDYLLARNIVDHRRCVDYNDLKNPFAGDVLPEKFYNCSIDVFKAIILFYRRVVEEIRTLRDKLNWLEWLDRQSAWQGGESPAELIAVYQVDENNWELDKRDFYELMFELARLIIAQVEQTLRKQWELMTSEEKLIKTRIINDDRLGDLYEELASQYAAAEAFYRANAPASFPLASFRGGNVHETILESKVYRELMRRIGMILGLFYKIAVGMEELSVDKNYAGTQLLRYMIVRPIRFRGKSVMDHITNQTGLLLKASRYFQSAAIFSELKGAPSARKELEAKQRVRDHIDANRVIEELISDSDSDGAPNAG